ncbi:hypothetical protein F2Q68_00026553 [Brassica cretica]|uniref:Uncharacterized protein n=1 Tax=Brassica cretica TaxID=69181 RepID=A0A8S9I9X8_BRACR|nr:hypothetical protein F2Q68_00026553 [Brassica cretica]
MVCTTIVELIVTMNKPKCPTTGCVIVWRSKCCNALNLRFTYSIEVPTSKTCFQHFGVVGKSELPRKLKCPLQKSCIMHFDALDIYKTSINKISFARGRSR